jgi:hypothetical protein
MTQRIAPRYIRVGYGRIKIPGAAVAGSSDTGSFPDSPAPTALVKAEIKRLQSECLRPAGIKSRTVYGNSTNVFCAKRWVVVAADDFEKATELAGQWLESNKYSTSFIHDAR